MFFYLLPPSPVCSKYRAVAAKGRNGVFCFHDDQEKPIYSYIQVPDRSTNLITDVREKVKISDLANSGCYCFADGRQLSQFCSSVIDKALVRVRTAYCFIELGVTILDEYHESRHPSVALNKTQRVQL